jgi:hypothetical protein
MNFAEFRKQNAEQAPATTTVSKPVDGARSGESEKEHQNNDLLKNVSKMPVDPAIASELDKMHLTPAPAIEPLIAEPKTVWIPKKMVVKEASIHHKVRVHFGDHSEVRFVDDDELGTLRASHRVKRVVHLGRSSNGRLNEYVTEGKEVEQLFKHPDGRKATVMSHKYNDESLGEDHYVHLPDSRASVFTDKDKAHRFLKKLGYAPTKGE